MDNIDAVIIQKPNIVPTNPQIFKSVKYAMSMVAMLVNESSMLLEEEIADSGDINMALKKGVNYPIGALEWGELWGYKSVVETLENLFHEYGERYRVSSWLKQRGKIG